MTIRFPHNLTALIGDERDGPLPILLHLLTNRPWAAARTPAPGAFLVCVGGLMVVLWASLGLLAIVGFSAFSLCGSKAAWVTGQPPRQ